MIPNRELVEAACSCRTPDECPWSGPGAPTPLGCAFQLRPAYETGIEEGVRQERERVRAAIEALSTEKAVRGQWYEKNAEEMREDVLAVLDPGGERVHSTGSEEAS